MIRPLTALTFLMASGSGLYLYQEKHEVQVLDHTIEKTVRDIAVLREQSRVLAAEWTTLSDPERLRTFSDRYLALKSIAPPQFTSFADLDKRLPALLPQSAMGRGSTDDDADSNDAPRLMSRGRLPPVPPLPVAEDVVAATAPAKGAPVGSAAGAGIAASRVAAAPSQAAPGAAALSAGSSSSAPAPGAVAASAPAVASSAAKGQAAVAAASPAPVSFPGAASAATVANAGATSGATPGATPAGTSVGAPPAGAQPGAIASAAKPAERRIAPAEPHRAAEAKVAESRPPIQQTQPIQQAQAIQHAQPVHFAAAKLPMQATMQAPMQPPMQAAAATPAVATPVAAAAVPVAAPYGGSLLGMAHGAPSAPRPTPINGTNWSNAN